MTTVSMEIWGPGLGDRPSHSLGEPQRVVELGEFQAVWRAKITIGSDPGCTVVLPELAPVEALLVGKSNHRVLYRLEPGATLPVPPLPWDRQYDQRVDQSPFALGTYWLQLREER